MSAKPVRKLFVVIQPLQYLQALELLQEDEENILIALGANRSSQLHNLIDVSMWHRVVWLSYSGSAMDIVKNSGQIRQLMVDLGRFDDVLVSSYYNPFMNFFVNANTSAKTMLLEDGYATLVLDSSTHYQSFKFRVKCLACRLLGFDIKPINNVTMFMLEKPGGFELPKIASDVVINNFSRLRGDLQQFPNDQAVYFISSAYINAKMLSREDYIDFLCRLAAKFETHSLRIMLHRFDDRSDFCALDDIANVTLIESEGPIEIYFQQQQINPGKLMSAGSGATETLRLIYGIEVEIIMPCIKIFRPEFREAMTVLAEHLKHSYDLSFL